MKKDHNTNTKSRLTHGHAPHYSRGKGRENDLWVDNGFVSLPHRVHGKIEGARDQNPCVMSVNVVEF